MNTTRFAENHVFAFLGIFSTRIQPVFDSFSRFIAFLCFSLLIFVFASKSLSLLITREACCHFAPPTQRTAVNSPLHSELANVMERRLGVRL